MPDIQKIRDFFSKDRFATDAGAYIEEVDEHYSKVSMPIDDRHKNAVGGVMGGVYFTLADFAFAVASNWKKAGTVSISSDISFVGVPKGQKLIAETSLIKDGRTTCCYSVSVTDELGTILAAVKITGYKTNP